MKYGCTNKTTPPAGSYTSFDSLRMTPSPQGEGFFIGRYPKGFPLRENEIRRCPWADKGGCSSNEAQRSPSSVPLSAANCPHKFVISTQSRYTLKTFLTIARKRVPVDNSGGKLSRRTVDNLSRLQKLSTGTAKNHGFSRVFHAKTVDNYVDNVENFK
ncbi:MAG: hypothetical protein IKM26_06635 [Clostridia bacterium]|nr:hypothetical protein [Clostridia bacterium]